MALSDLSTGIAASVALHVGVVAAVIGVLGGDGGRAGEGETVYLVEVVSDIELAREDQLQHATPSSPEPTDQTGSETASDSVSTTDTVSKSKTTRARRTEPLKITARALSGGGEESGGGAARQSVRYEAPEILSLPTPRYPRAARRLGHSGRARYKVKVAPSGDVAHIEVASSSGSELLDRTGRESIEKALFKPARQAGVPVEGEKVVSIVFDLVD